MFELDATLAKNSFFIADFSLSQCRLMNQADFSWLLLIPRLPHQRELIDLSLDQQMQLLREVNIAARALQDLFPCDKLNIATLGNQVSQLHMHVIARTQQDPAWPHPVWGAPPHPYPSSQSEKKLAQLQAYFSKNFI